MIRAGIIGATGYAGAELVRILSGHPGVRISVITSRQYAGKRVDEIYPMFSGGPELVCRPYTEALLTENCDVAFTALPHKLPLDIVPDLLERGMKVVDLSADFRFDDAALYERHYQPHTAGDVLSEAVYGLSEVYEEKISKARLVGNPGCYPTSILLPLIPLIERGAVDASSVIADSKSGTSGAGRSPSLITHFCEVHESFKAYKVITHRHNPEIDEKLSHHAGKPVHITFVPHLTPMSRGMLSTLYCQLTGPISEEALSGMISDYYRGRTFIRVRTDDRLPDTRHVRGTNYCDIAVRVEADGKRAVILSVIDNLVKGAAGQAVQNMNLMFGLNEAAGLDTMPYPL